MARSISEIKNSMTAEFMANKDVRDLYDLSENDTFNEVFSVVSLESILFGVVATIVWTLETLFDRHKEEVSQVIQKNIVASVGWYHDLALKYQKGDKLEYDESTNGFKYAVEDKKKQIVKYAAVRDAGRFVRMLVSGESNGLPVKLEDSDLAPFKEYMNRVKIAGVIIDISSYQPDTIRIAANCTVDPLVIDFQGRKIVDGSYPVVDAIDNYLKNIDYGGVFNKNKLIDAIQNVQGVVDIDITSVRVSFNNSLMTEISGNNYTAQSGCLVRERLDISYV